jgi:serine/threonine protein kinase
MDEEMKNMEQMVEDSQSRTGTVTKQDFQMLSVIGKGAYGKVLLVKKKDLQNPAGGELYAMKVLKKSEILKRNQVEHTMTERRILGSVRHPFIVKMDYAF